MSPRHRGLREKTPRSNLPPHPVYQAPPPAGARAAERLAEIIGSWRFLILQSVGLAAWIGLNSAAGTRHWDEFPFILLNLALSFQAAYTGPVLLIASNRQSAKDRALAEHTYEESQAHRQLLAQNIRLTEEIHRLLQEIHDP